MKYCLRCAREIGEGHSFCPYCGTSQKEIKKNEPGHISCEKPSKIPIIVGIIVIMAVVLIIAAFVERANTIESNNSYKTVGTPTRDNSFSAPVIAVSARQILSDFNNNEIRAGDQYNGKRVRISGCAAGIDNMMGVLSISINSCGGDFDIDYVRAQFPNSAKEKLSRLNKGQKVVVECTIDDGGDIMGVAASNCILK